MHDDQDRTPGVDHGLGANSPGRAAIDLPRLLAFYEDVWDADGNPLGWRTIAWGLAFADGSAISVPVAGPVAVTLWLNVEDAATALDAYVDSPQPRRVVADLPAFPGSPDRASTISSPGSSDGSAARPACSRHPHEGADDQGRPSGVHPTAEAAEAAIEGQGGDRG